MKKTISSVSALLILISVLFAIVLLCSCGTENTLVNSVDGHDDSEESQIIEKTENNNPIEGRWEFVNMSPMGLSLIWPDTLEANGISLPVFECDSKNFLFSFPDYNTEVLNTWKEVDPDSIEIKYRDPINLYVLDDTNELYAYFNSTDNFDYKYIYLQARMNGSLYEMRFKRQE